MYATWLYCVNVIEMKGNDSWYYSSKSKLALTLVFTLPKMKVDEGKQSPFKESQFSLRPSL